MIASCLAVSTSYVTLTAAEAASKLRAGFFGALVDTRTADEWAAGHLPNATLIEELHLGSTATAGPVAGCERCNVGVYCHSGVRSKQAALVLEAAGFASVFDVLGIVQWQEAGEVLVHDASISPPCASSVGAPEGTCGAAAQPPASLAGLTSAGADPPASLVGLTSAPPGEFDYFVLALYWQPEWAANACPDGARPDARLVAALSADAGSYARSGLSLHGLWPDFDAASAQATEGFGWPQWCNTCLASETPSNGCRDFGRDCQQGGAALPECAPAAATASFNTSERWGRYALQMAYGDLATHEWGKHGSCSPWHAEPAAYFAAAEAALAHATAGRGAALLAPGGAVTHATLVEAFTADTGAAPAILCSEACRLQQVWIGLPRSSDGGVELSGGGVDLGASDTCAACERVEVAAWQGCGNAAAAACAFGGPPCPAGVPLWLWILVPLVPVAIAAELLWRVHVSTHGLLYECVRGVWLCVISARGAWGAQWSGKVNPAERLAPVQKQWFFPL